MLHKRILLVDDHAIFRRGLCALLGEANAGARVDEAGSVEDALAPDAPLPDLVLLDINLPGINGLDGIALVRRRWPAARVIVLSGLDAPEASAEALACGAADFISKRESAERILERISRILDQEGAPKTDAPPAKARLTPRQREVLAFLVQGLSNKLIARQIAVSENTVRRHVQDIIDYFGVESRSEAVFAARRRGLVE